MNDLKALINTYLGLIFKIGLTLVIFSTLFLFTNLSTEFYDTAKFLTLLAFSGIILVLLAIKFTLDNKVVFVRTPLDIPLLLLLAVGIVSTVVSPAPYLSLLGNQLKINGSLSSLAVYIIFYFVLVNSIKSAKEIRWFLSMTMLGAAILSVITLLAYAGVKILPSPWIHGINFTPTGSSFSTTAVLALLVPIVTGRIITGGNITVQLLNSVILTLFSITIALTGNLATWIAASIGLILSLASNRFFDSLTAANLKSIKWQISLISLVIPLASVILVTALSLIPPLGGSENLLYTQAKKFPKEPQVPFVASWKISISTFRDTPFWGSGPSTYLFNFTNYKPIEINSSKLWNIRFDSAFNEYLQVLATLGGVGLIALLSLTALFISSAYSSITVRQTFPDEQHTTHNELKTALAIAGLVFFVILALHTSTLVIWVFGLILLALFMVINISPQGTSRSWSLSTNIQHTLLRIAGNVSSINSSEETIKIEAFPSILLTISLGAVLFSFFFAGKFALADYHHRVALNAVAQNQGIIAYNELIAAEKLNPYNDLYRVDLAQTNFALANAIASAKAPTESSPAGSLTDQDRQNIQVLLQQSINEGRTATTLSPRSALNWEVLGLLYRQIAGVATNALAFSLDSYGRAIFQDPLNPQLRLNVGGVYYAIQNFDLAIRFFTDAINLKPDFANGYYNLSVALRDKGDLANAQAAAEKALTLVEADSQDYKVANNYLTDLKNRIASGTAQQSPIQPPAAQTSGALQEKDLPKVIDLDKPEKIATPPAVKKPNATPEPTQQP